MKITFNHNQGKIIAVEDDKGNPIRQQREGPEQNEIRGVAAITIIETNPSCWIPSAGGWYKVPC